MTAIIAVAPELSRRPTLACRAWRLDLPSREPLPCERSQGRNVRCEPLGQAGTLRLAERDLIAAGKHCPAHQRVRDRSPHQPRRKQAQRSVGAASLYARWHHVLAVGVDLEIE